MSKVREVPFNALPRALRDRFVAITRGDGSPQPIWRELTSTAAGVAGWVFLGLCGAALVLGLSVWGFGEVYSDGALQGWPYLALYAAGAFLAVWSLLRLVRRARLAKSLPYRPGRYLLPLDLVDARTDRLRILPLAAATKIDGVHHHTNGRYNYTELTFRFEGGWVETFFIGRPELAQGVLDQVLAMGRIAKQAVEDRDLELLGTIDPFLELHATGAWPTGPAKSEPEDGPRARTMPFVLARAAVVSLAVALVVSPMVVFARDYASDSSMISSLRAHPDSSRCQIYLHHDGGHATEVRDELLPLAVYQEAQRQGSVTALRDFLRAHPQSRHAPAARRDMAQLYDNALEQFRREASTEDPRTVPFMTSLLGWQEAHDTPTLQVRFLPPSAEALALADRLLADREGLGREIDRPVAPIAPHFSDEVNLARERTIAELLQQGFGRVFPNDILRIENGPRLTPEEIDAEITEPRIQVSYSVVPSGTMYEEEGGNRLFVGIQVVFDVRMRIPGDAQGLDFRLDVEPPERFTVSSFSPAWMGQLESSSSDGQVYSVMALRAFDQLSNRLTAVFFRTPPPAEPADPAEQMRRDLAAALGTTI